jgi:hypothetical protein
LETPQEVAEGLKAFWADAGLQQSGSAAVVH